MGTGLGGPKRAKLSEKRSKRQFTKYASRTHKLNVAGAAPMRGGIRL